MQLTSLDLRRAAMVARPRIAGDCRPVSVLRLLREQLTHILCRQMTGRLEHAHAPKVVCVEGTQPRPWLGRKKRARVRKLELVRVPEGWRMARPPERRPVGGHRLGAADKEEGVTAQKGQTAVG